MMKYASTNVIRTALQFFTVMTCTMSGAHDFSQLMTSEQAAGFSALNTQMQQKVLNATAQQTENNVGIEPCDTIIVQFDVAYISQLSMCKDATRIIYIFAIYSAV